MYLKRLLEKKKALALYFVDNSIGTVRLLTISKNMLTNNSWLLAGKAIVGNRGRL